MPISIKANPQSSVIVAPKRVVSDDYFVDDTFHNLVTNSGDNLVTNSGDNLLFNIYAYVYPLKVKSNPQSNVIVAPEKI